MDFGSKKADKKKNNADFALWKKSNSEDGNLN
jgi:cysteinyl-tRNA synthetase